MCRAFQDTLRHDDHVIMTDTSTNLVWMETFITTLDHLDLYTYRYIVSLFRPVCVIIGRLAECHVYAMFFPSGNMRDP